MGIYSKTLITVFLVSALWSSAGVYAETVLRYEPQLLDASKEPFKFNLGPDPDDQYLIMSIPYPPTSQLTAQLESQIGRSLLDRGESHITVITPREAAVLNKYVSIQEIHQVALQMQIQQTQYDLVCIGSGEAELEGSPEQTYYIVVRAPWLLEIRREIARRFVARGGRQSEFVYDSYFPHITLGFTRRDLFEQDGVRKDSASCMFELAG